MDIWNETVKIRDLYSARTAAGKRISEKNDRVVNLACIYLSQMNTAGGQDMIRHEVEAFVNKFGGLNK